MIKNNKRSGNPQKRKTAPVKRSTAESTVRSPGTAERVHWDGAALLGPVPAVFVTCADGEKSNVFTVAWTGIICSKPAKTYISVRPERYSHGIISKSGEFTINLASSALVRALDRCGVHSGRDHDKFSENSLDTVPGNLNSCPQLAASPLSLECKVTDVLHLGSHDMFLADIAGCEVRSDLITDDGKLDMSSAGLLAYNHGEYFALGKKIGQFGFSVKKRKKPEKRSKVK